MSLNPEQQAFEQINRAKRILITTRAHATNDAIASTLACFLFLQKLGKDSAVVIPEFKSADVPSFLPALENIRSKVGALRAFHISLDLKNVPLDELLYDVQNQTLEITLVPKTGEWTPADVTLHPGEKRYDLIIAVDAPDFQSLGELARDHADFLYQTPILNIDSNPSNENWGQVNIIDLNAVSTTEILFGLFEKWNRNLINEDIATTLLVGLIAKTDSFRSPNVTPKTLTVASQLAAMGARREQIVHGLWRTRTVPVLKIWGRALSRLEQDKDTGLIWSTLTRQDFVETGATEEALNDIFKELVAYAPEARVVVFFSEPVKPGPAMVSVHARAPLSAIDLTRQFNAVGTREFASFKFQENSSLIEETQNVIRKINASLKQ